MIRTFEQFELRFRKCLERRFFSSETQSMGHSDHKIITLGHFDVPTPPGGDGGGALKMPKYAHLIPEREMTCRVVN